MFNRNIDLIVFSFGKIVFGKVIKARTDIDLSFITNLDRKSLVFYEICKDKEDAKNTIIGLSVHIKNINKSYGYVTSEDEKINRSRLF